MPNQLVLAGSQSQKQKNRKYAPIWVNRYVSGYWPNRNPLRDATLPVLQEKFYGALNDALIDGLNCEINNRSELVRRFGNSVYNSNTAGPQQRFYSFPVFGNNNTPVQRVLSSSATQITDITNNGSALVYLKPAGAQKTVFQSIGDTCFFSDTISPKQLLSFTTPWQPNNLYTFGTDIVDTNNNVQKNLGAAVTITNIAITVTSGVSTLTVTYTGSTAMSVGSTATLLGLTTATFLNGLNIVLTTFGGGTLTAIVNAPAYASASDTGVVYTTAQQASINLNNISLTANVITYTSNAPTPVGIVVTFQGIVNVNFSFLNGTTMTVTSTGFGGGVFTTQGSYTHANVAIQNVPGAYVTFAFSNALSGGVQPTWSGSYGGITIDNTTAWLYSGPAVRNVGIVPPQNAPLVSNTPAAPQGATWVASTYYLPAQIIYDSGTTSIQQLTTAGTTAGAPPAFSGTFGVTTNDGSAVWTSQGTAVRATNTPYTTGKFIRVSWSKTIIIGYTTNGLNSDVPGGGKGSPTQESPKEPIYSTVTYRAFFQSTTAGTTSTTSTVSLDWPLSGSILDGTVTWSFIGLEILRSTTSSSPTVTTTTFTSGVVGNTQLISISGTNSITNPFSTPINDTLNYEVVTVAGKSGTVAPTWSTKAGGTTTDNGVIWTNIGLSGSTANTGNWFYAYAFLSTTTPDVSSASPISIPIQRAAGSWISISGNTSSDLQVDTIRIYRSLQQVTSVTTVSGDQLFQLIDIPMPSGGTWQYLDTTDDPPNANSSLNTFVIADTDGINTPPLSSITNFVYYLGRLWGSIGNTVYASAGPDVVNGGNPFTAFPPSNFMDFPALVIRMVPSSQGLTVYTSDGVQIIVGNGVAAAAGVSGFTTFIPVIYADNIDLGGYDGLTIDGATTYIYTKDRNILSLSSSGLSWISTAISNKLRAAFTLPDGTSVNFDPSSSYLTWFQNGDDFGLFLSDGSKGWFRMMPSTSPDSGNMVWSPFAEIVGGVSAVQNIETVVGVHNLLIGPGVSGPILKRDFSVNTDNGTTFSWFATFGSIILAHPGEIAMVQSVVVDSLAVGSHPAITVYFDEINSTGVSFLYNDYKFDPYGGAESTTVYMDRFYMSDVPDSVAICRHLQLQINFPAEDAANTLLSTTIIGATEYDN